VKTRQRWAVKPHFHNLVPGLSVLGAAKDKGTRGQGDREMDSVTSLAESEASSVEVESVRSFTPKWRGLFPLPHPISANPTLLRSPLESQHKMIIGPESMV